MPRPTPDRGDASAATEPPPHPQWFVRFLEDRQTRKPSAHTMKAYAQDFVAIAAIVTDGLPAEMAVADITRDSMRSAFAIRRIKRWSGYPVRG